MKRINMKYGDVKIPVCIKDENLLGIIEANKVKIDRDEDQIIMDALKNPIYINKTAMECDHIVLTGGIIYHLLVG